MTIGSNGYRPFNGSGKKALLTFSAEIKPGASPQVSLFMQIKVPTNYNYRGLIEGEVPGAEITNFKIENETAVMDLKIHSHCHDVYSRIKGFLEHFGYTVDVDKSSLQSIDESLPNRVAGYPTHWDRPFDKESLKVLEDWPVLMGEIFPGKPLHKTRLIGEMYTEAAPTSSKPRISIPYLIAAGILLAVAAGVVIISLVFGGLPALALTPAIKYTAIAIFTSAVIGSGFSFYKSRVLNFIGSSRRSEFPSKVTLPSPRPPNIPPVIPSPSQVGSQSEICAQKKSGLT